MLSEDSVPESTYNLTLVPLDVPGAMISVTTSIYCVVSTGSSLVIRSGLRLSSGPILEA